MINFGWWFQAMCFVKKKCVFILKKNLQMCRIWQITISVGGTAYWYVGASSGSSSPVSNNMDDNAWVPENDLKK